MIAIIEGGLTMLRCAMSRMEKQASTDANVEMENSAWSLVQDERKFDRPINANELNSNIGWSV